MTSMKLGMSEQATEYLLLNKDFLFCSIVVTSMKLGMSETGNRTLVIKLRFVILKHGHDLHETWHV